MTERQALRILKHLGRHSPQGGCWIWRGPLSRTGQPVLSIDGTGTLVHRFAYLACWDRGHALRGELHPHVPLVQACGDRRCVNPAHLVPVRKSFGEIQEPRGLFNRSKPSCPQGHPYSGGNLAVRRNRRRRCLACHRESSRRRRARRLAESLDAGPEEQGADWAV